MFVQSREKEPYLVVFCTVADYQRQYRPGLAAPKTGVDGNQRESRFIVSQQISISPTISTAETDNRIDQQYALLAAQLSGFAYESQRMVEAELEKLGYTDNGIMFFDTKLAAGFLVELQGVLFVIFKGSSTIKDWVNNLRIGVVPTDVGFIHAGFYDSFQSIATDLHPTIAAHLDRGQKLVIAGHSRGGAIATLFAAYVCYMGSPVHAVITFGSPKIGDQTFVDWCETNMKCIKLRFVNGADIVPLFPPGNWKEFWTLLWAVTFALPIYIATSIGRSILARVKRILS